MTDKELRETADRTKNEINCLLTQKTDEAFQKVVGICKDDSFSILQGIDNDLRMAYLFSSCYYSEKNYLSRTTFDCIDNGIDSSPLQQLQDIFSTVGFGVMRIENEFPNELVEDAVSYISSMNLSGEFLYQVVVSYAEDPVKIILYFSSLMKADGKFVCSIRLLSYAEKLEPDNSKIYLMQAENYVETERFDKAYEELDKIKEPDEDTQKLMLVIKPYTQGKKSEVEQID